MMSACLHTPVVLLRKYTLCGSLLIAMGLWACQRPKTPKFEFEPLVAEHMADMQMLNVPLVEQKLPRECGAAAMEMVLRYWGKPADQGELMKELDTGDKRGLAARDMKELAERQGLRAFIVAGSADDIYRWLDRQIPLIVARRVALPGGLGNHYMVVVGHSRDKDFLAINDPEKGQIRVLLEGFLPNWTEAQRFLMVVAPGPTSAPSEAPAAAE